MRAGGLGPHLPHHVVSVKQPIPTLALSNTARTGLWAWAKTAAADLFADGHHPQPGLPRLPRHRPHEGQLGRAGGAAMGDPADFGRVVAFLCSEPAKFVSGIAVLVDGGESASDC